MNPYFQLLKFIGSALGIIERKPGCGSRPNCMGPTEPFYEVFGQMSSIAVPGYISIMIGLGVFSFFLWRGKDEGYKLERKWFYRAIISFATAVISFFALQYIFVSLTSAPVY